MASFAARVLHNTLTSIAAHVFVSVLSLLLVPIILLYVGTEAYGLWAIVTFLVGAFGLFDLGIGNATIRMTAELHGRSDYVELNRLLGLTSTTYFTMACAFSAPMAIMATQIAKVLKVSDELLPVATVLFASVGGLLLLFALSAIVRSILIGLQRYDLANLVATIGSVVHAVLVVSLLFAGFELYALPLGMAISYVIQTIIGLTLVRRECPSLGLSMSGFSYSRLRVLIRSSSHLQVASLGFFLSFHLPKLVLGILAGTAQVAYYEIAYKALKAVRDLSAVLSSALLPAASYLQSQPQDRKVNQLYERGTKYVAVLTLPMWAFIIVFAQPIVLLWLGSDYHTAGRMLQIIGAGVACWALSGVAGSILQSSPHPTALTYSTLLGIALNLVLGTYLASTWGPSFVALGVGMGFAASGLLLLLSFHRDHQIPLWPTVRAAILKPSVICAMSLATSYWLYSLLLSARLGVALSLAVSSVIFAVAYFTTVRRATFFDSEDVQILSHNRWTRLALSLLHTQRSN